MLFSRDWLGQYVELPSDAAELAARLTAAGLAVEGVEERDGDVVLDVEVTTNRPDAMCHLGLAREVAALYGKPLRLPEAAVPTAATAATVASTAARLVVEDPELCPRYDALVIRGVKVGPSPEWLVRRLETIGARSINNVVDVTNFVLWETGQPQHAFDLDRLAAGADGLPEVRVRRARAGERLRTLDGEERQLDPEILVIADAAMPIGLGGIMGGLDSEVTAATTRILLESAHFSPPAVRRGGKKLGLHTDARHRFERGADPEACLWAARRAAALIVEVAGGEVLAGELEAYTPRPEWPPRLDLELARLVRFGGVELTAAEVEATLTGLGFALERHGGDAPAWRVRVPSWRYYDFARPYPADLYEEVLRVHGFDDIPATLPQIGGADARERPEHARRRQIHDRLAACGFVEAIDFAFHDRTSDAAFPSLWGDRPPLALANPLSDRYAVMRRSLLPNLVESARYNQRRSAPAVRLFEVGHIFAEDDINTEDGAAGEVLERETVALVLGGELGTPWEHQRRLDFFDLKGALESLAEALGVDLEARPAELPGLLRGTTAEIFVVGEDEVAGFLGELAVGEGPYPLFVAELATDRLAAEPCLEVIPPSKFPGIAVDSTLTHSLATPWSAIVEAIEELDVLDLVEHGLKDRYQGPGTPPGAVSTTLYFLYNSSTRSLTQEEVNERHRELVEELETCFGVAGA